MTGLITKKTLKFKEKKNKDEVSYEFVLLPGNHYGK